MDREKDELREEYSLSDFPAGLERGKYAGRMAEGSNIVRLDPDVAAVFPDSAAVNSTLRALIEIAGRAAGPSVKEERPS